MEPFRQRDKRWLLALPVYLFILILRHEGSHALVAVFYESAQLSAFQLLPGISEQGTFVRPHIRVSGAISWASVFGPYLADLLTFAAVLPFCLFARLPKWLWLNVAVIGVLSPFLNSLANYLIGLYRPQSDVGRLFEAWPPLAVHAYFATTLAVYAFGLLLLRRVARGAGSIA